MWTPGLPNGDHETAGCLPGSMRSSQNFKDKIIIIKKDTITCLLFCICHLGTIKFPVLGFKKHFSFFQRSTYQLAAWVSLWDLYRLWWHSCDTLKFEFFMNMTGTCGIPYQMPTKPSAAWKSRIRSRQPRARCLGSNCQFNNLLVIRPQNIGRLPVVTAPTVCVHLISSRLLTQKLFVIIYSQSFRASGCTLGWALAEVIYVTHYWDTLLNGTIMRQRATTTLSSE